MSELKLTVQDAKAFYSSVYKNLYNDPEYLDTNPHLKSKINSVLDKKESFNTRQLEYYPLAMDFFKIAHTKKINPEVLINYIGMSPEFWSVWVDSYNSGNVATPVSLMNSIVDKMSAFVLKDRVNNYIADNQIDIASTSKEEILSSIITEEKNYKLGKENLPANKVNKIKLNV